MFKLLRNFIRKNGKYGLRNIMIIFAYNGYFIFLMHERAIHFLLYLDFLVILFLAVVAGVDFVIYVKWECEKEQFLRYEDIIYNQLPPFENREITQHDICVLEEKQRRQFEENCELQDNIARWCHEWKLPLAACLMINEKIKDAEIRRDLREPLERMNRQVNMMLQECRLQSPLMDLQIERISLEACVKASIKNNRFFLIQKKFTIDIQVENILVYSDFAWLVYILDQLLGNAAKYASKEQPQLKIWAGKESKEAEQVCLFIEDNGEGIKDSDIRRVFEKGFTGQNYHNGKYKSTGMGLYLVQKVADKLEHKISVESVFGKYTRFCIVLRAEN